ncbi:hypothetical protein GCM10010441_43130 [Kitasatospora paracochleata]
MRPATLLVAAALLTATACSSSASPATAPAASGTAAAAGAAAPKPVPAKDAAAVLASLAAAVPSAKQGTVVTEASDANHLLGRPGQYTSKVTFTDSRIQAADVDGFKEDDVERGGAVEVFASAKDAQTRAAYIQSVVKGLPALMEYDFVHGPVVVRASRFLTPTQAGELDKAAAVFGAGS